MTDDPTAALRALIARIAADPPNGGYFGTDWWQLAEQEADVFEIDPGDMPMLVTTWEAYEAFHRLVHGARFDMEHQATVDAAKAARPDLAAMPPYNINSWQTFAAAFGPLTYRQAWQWYAKYDAYSVRAGVIVFRDEKPAETPPQ